MTMTSKNSARVRLRDQRGNKLLKNRHKGHIVLALVGGFFVVLTIHLRLVISSFSEVHLYYGDLLATLQLSSPSASSSSPLIPFDKEQNVTVADDILLSIRSSELVTIAYAISLIKVRIHGLLGFSIPFLW
jgi:hypothetical protein